MSKKDFQNGYVAGLSTYLFSGKGIVVNPANAPLIKVKGQFEDSNSYFYENIMSEDNTVDTAYLHRINKVATVDFKVPFSMRADGEIALAMRFFDASGYHLDTVQAISTDEGSGEFSTDENYYPGGVLTIYLNQILQEVVTPPEDAEYFDLVLFISSSSIVIDAELINLVYDK